LNTARGRGGCGTPVEGDREQTLPGFRIDRKIQAGEKLGLVFFPQRTRGGPCKPGCSELNTTELNGHPMRTLRTPKTQQRAGPTSLGWKGVQEKGTKN